MTDYDAMTDEQLAALVAERVMGWTWDGDLSAWVSVIDEGGDVRWHCDRLTWAPATQWSDAGRVLEKMRADGWDCLVTIDGHMEGRSQRAIVHVSRAGSGGFGHADSPCRAICIAALRAVDA